MNWKYSKSITIEFNYSTTKDQKYKCLYNVILLLFFIKNGLNLKLRIRLLAYNCFLNHKRTKNS